MRRVRLGETDVADERLWLERDLNRRGARFGDAAWRALALRSLLDDEGVATPAWVEGEIEGSWLFAFYGVPEDFDAEEAEGLAGRALEAWLAVTSGL